MMEVMEDNRKVTDIPIGKSNRITRDSLMYKLKIFNVNQFKKELAELKEKYIILFENDGYYRPNKAEEYLMIITKQKEIIDNANKIIEIAKKEMESE